MEAPSGQNYIDHTTWETPIHLCVRENQRRFISKNLHNYTFTTISVLHSLHSISADTLSFEISSWQYLDQDKMDVSVFVWPVLLKWNVQFWWQTNPVTCLLSVVIATQPDSQSDCFILKCLCSCLELTCHLSNAAWHCGLHLGVSVFIISG